jgi:hypothetical protein
VSIYRDPDELEMCQGEPDGYCGLRVLFECQTCKRFLCGMHECPACPKSEGGNG